MRKESTLDQTGQLIVQSYLNINLIIQLHAEGFIASEYFSSLKLAQTMKTSLKEVGVDNQAMLLMFLYALLVLPKDLVGKAYSDDYEEINQWLNNLKMQTESTYTYNKPHQYIRHIRNSVAHGRVEFQPNETVTFNDKNRQGATFKATMPLKQIFTFIQKLSLVHSKYITKHNNSKLSK